MVISRGPPSSSWAVSHFRMFDLSRAGMRPGGTIVQNLAAALQIFLARVSILVSDFEILDAMQQPAKAFRAQSIAVLYLLQTLGSNSIIFSNHVSVFISS